MEIGVKGGAVRQGDERSTGSGAAREADESTGSGAVGSGRAMSWSLHRWQLSCFCSSSFRTSILASTRILQCCPHPPTPGLCHLDRGSCLAPRCDSRSPSHRPRAEREACLVIRLWVRGTTPRCRTTDKESMYRWMRGCTLVEDIRGRGLVLI